MLKTGRYKSVTKSAIPGHRRLRELEAIAELLNWRSGPYPEPWSRARSNARRIVEGIVLSPSLTQAAKQFTIHAAVHPLRMEVEMGRKVGGDSTPIPILASPLPHLDEVGHALGRLWRAYFHAEGWKRLKHCTVCPRWFVDLTSDTRKQRCSVVCTNRWWSYSKRKQADYTRFKNGGYHGKAKTKRPR